MTMAVASPVFIQSRDNPLLKMLRKLQQDNGAYRKLGQVWVEGDHLCSAALVRGVRPAVAVFAASYWPSAAAQWLDCGAAKTVVVADALLRECSGLESPAPLGFVLDVPPAVTLQARMNTVVLDRVQDAGNVGSILRSAAAFGFGQILALTGSAALWSPKVLRAAMGAHFGLVLHEGCTVQDIATLDLPLLVTSSHQGELIHQAALPQPCAWALGHEGQGVCEALAAQAALAVRIGQPGGEESLNVAAAAAICLHASSVSLQRQPS